MVPSSPPSDVPPAIAGTPRPSRPTAVAERAGVVWIVDDSPDEAEMARRALGPTFTTQIFTSAAALVTQIVKSPLPDVLVLDWMMPDVSGIELCKFLRTWDAAAELSILLLTAHAKIEQIVEGLAAGANDYVIRPYSSAELTARVSSLIRSRRLRERAESAQRSMKALLAHLPDALITTTADGEISFLNAEAERILATSTDAVKGKRLEQCFPALAKIHELPLEGEGFEALAEFDLGSALFAPAVRRMSIDGESTIAVALRDVTDKRRLERRRLDFYSMVAHDLRAPLTAMTLRVGLMRKEPHGTLADPYRKDLEIVEGRIGQLVSLVDDFLDIARSEGVGITLVPSRMDLAELVRANLADFECIAQQRDVTVHLNEPKTSVEAVADSARLRQVITNLVSNAVKFSSKGGQVLIELSKRDGSVEFAVSDAGRGIAEDKISELFKRYSRPNDSAMPGTGLGLMIVQEIVTAHAGTCGVESTVGKGSRFWFRIPAA